MRTKMLGLAAVIAGGLGATSAADAAPLTIGPFDGLAGPPIERVADGCGPGFHANPWGRCRPNRWGPPDGGYDGPPRGYGYDRGYDRPPPPPPGPRYYRGY